LFLLTRTTGGLNIPLNAAPFKEMGHTMTVEPFILSRAVKQARRWLRKTAYADMARQVSGPVPDQTRVEKQGLTREPIKLDFKIPKKHRLNWRHRTVHQLPR
jgi:hypothetical protein